jgi:hypothetical protein
MNNQIATLILIAAHLIAVAEPAGAQSQEHMEQLLNVLDRPNGWQRTPVTGGPPIAQGRMQPGMMVNSGGMQPGMMVNNGGMQPGMMVNSGGMQPGMMVNNGGMQPGMIVNNGGMRAPVQQAADSNPFSMRNLLRTFLGDSPGGNKADDSAALGNARSQYQVASDQACQAEGAEGRTKYGDKGSRMNAAYSAQCHADAARAAADRATGVAAGKSSPVNDAAAQARNAAARAQAAADRARYNAATFNPTL